MINKVEAVEEYEVYEVDVYKVPNTFKVIVLVWRFEDYPEYYIS